MRTKKRKKLASAQRGPVESATGANERWSMDFITDRLENGRYFRALRVVVQYTRECVALEPALSLTAAKVVDVLERVAVERGYPRSITVDNGSEFCSRIMDGWAYEHSVKLDFIRPGKPVENGYIESFNGRGYRAPFARSTRQSFPAIHSPYSWAGPQHYTAGKYVRDHEYSPTA